MGDYREILKFVNFNNLKIILFIGNFFKLNICVGKLINNQKVWWEYESMDIWNKAILTSLQKNPNRSEVQINQRFNEIQRIRSEF